MNFLNRLTEQSAPNHPKTIQVYGISTRNNGWSMQGLQGGVATNGGAGGGSGYGISNGGVNVGGGGAGGSGLSVPGFVSGQAPDRERGRGGAVVKNSNTTGRYRQQLR